MNLPQSATDFLDVFIGLSSRKDKNGNRYLIINLSSLFLCFNLIMINHIFIDAIFHILISSHFSSLLSPLLLFCPIRSMIWCSWILSYLTLSRHMLSSPPLHHTLQNTHSVFTSLNLPRIHVYAFSTAEDPILDIVQR